VKTHHRNYPFRPPRRDDAAGAADSSLYVRFARAYLLPHKWPLLACVFMVGVNACSVYLMSFYGRYVVDSILIVRPAVQDGQGGQRQKRRVWADDRRRRTPRQPRQGIGRRIDMGLAVSPRPPGSGVRLAVLYGLYVGTLITLNFLARLAQRTRIRVGQSITARLREDMHRKVLELSLSYHKSHDPGQLLSRILSDVAIVQQHLMMSILTLSRSVSMIVVGVVILVLADWRLALIALTVIPLYAAVYSRTRPKIREITRELRHTNSCLYGLTSQKFDGMKAIQAYGREGRERLNFHRLVACLFRDALYQQRLSAGLSRASQIISGLGAGAIFLLGARFVLDGRMTLGKMMFVYAATANLFMPVIELTRLGVIFNSLLIVLQRLVDVLDRKVEIVDAPNAVEFPSPLQRGIALRHVRFSYSTAPEAEPVLRDVCLHVPVGTWLCVMGASGCGKTTLLYLLGRLYEPTAGRIRIDGIPLNRIKMASLRNAVGFVPQEAQIFSGTVRDNICYGAPGAPPKRIMAAAQAAELHDFILEMPVQYETTIGEKGTSLSGGQRQRLSLARALLTDPEVLLLDDCTSALDADTEQRIQNTLSRILVGKTAIIVSQRVSMAKRCHRICTIENGVISEYGAHDELVGAGGFYARLHAQQTE